MKIQTVLTTGVLALGVALAGMSFAADKKAPAPIVAAATTDAEYQIKLLFIKDGCSVYEFYREGVRHTLVAGKTSFCSLTK